MQPFKSISIELKMRNGKGNEKEKQGNKIFYYQNYKLSICWQFLEPFYILTDRNYDVSSP